MMLVCIRSTILSVSCVTNPSCVVQAASPVHLATTRWEEQHHAQNAPRDSHALRLTQLLCGVKQERTVRQEPLLACRVNEDTIAQ